MSYGLVCDTLHAHRKTAKAGLEAMGMWAVALSWSKDKRTGGYIPAGRPLALAEDDAEVAERCVTQLVKARLWEPAEDGGWRFHDWQEHQRSPEDDEARKEARRAAKVEAGRKGGLARAANAKQAQAEPEQGQTLAKQDQADASRTKRTQAPPSEPKPKSEPKSEIPPKPPLGGDGAGPALPLVLSGGEDPKPRRRRGKAPEVPMPDGWGPKPKHYRTGEERGLDRAGVNREAERFKAQRASKGARYADWDAAFTSWLLSPFQDSGGAPGKAWPARAPAVAPEPGGGQRIADTMARLAAATTEAP